MIAGEYGLSVTNPQGDLLMGSPFAISIRPGPISAKHSSLKLLHETSIVAGSEAQLKLTACDQHGNQVRQCLCLLMYNAFNVCSCLVSI